MRGSDRKNPQGRYLSSLTPRRMAGVFLSASPVAWALACDKLRKREGILMGERSYKRCDPSWLGHRRACLGGFSSPAKSVVNACKLQVRLNVHARDPWNATLGSIASHLAGSPC